jgi:N-alpha-acetyl-L-2,4-diaminobutyrate deacetylase
VPRLADVSGRIIILPFLNAPAVRAGRRSSPIDGGNLNRVFPGDPRGSVTQRIAHFVQHELLPIADYVLDIHSGGRSLEFLPFAAAHILQDKAQQERCTLAAKAFGAPYTVILEELDSQGMYDTAAEASGLTFVTTEIGGGGCTTPSTTAIAARGVRNLLAYWKVVRGAPFCNSDTIVLSTPAESSYIISDAEGVLEICVELGSFIKKGQIIAKIYDTHDLGKYSREYMSRVDGILIGRRTLSNTAHGDCIAVIGALGVKSNNEQ